MEEEALPVRINGRAVWKIKELVIRACAHTHTHPNDDVM
jgi:hypothetical protein